MKERERKKIGFLLGIFVLLCFIFMIGFQYDNSYKITGREDIVNALNYMPDGGSYTEKDIYTYHKSKDRIDLLYKNNTYKDYYVFCILKKNKYFKDRYEVLFEKKNIYKDAQCHMFHFTNKDKSYFVLYGLDLDLNTYNTIGEMTKDELTFYNFNPLSGNLLKVFESNGNTQYFFNSFVTKKEREAFLEEENFKGLNSDQIHVKEIDMTNFLFEIS